MIVDGISDRRSLTNILADTATVNWDNVTIVGSHLDSVLEGPGINDNGSGSAFNLEFARPDRQAQDQAGQQDPLCVVGRRGVGPGRRDALRRVHLE